MIRCVTRCPDALERLKTAFRACPHDFDLLCDQVKVGKVSIYELSADKYHVTVAGEVINNDYYLWAVAGHGTVPAIRELTKYVKSAGLQKITAETYFPSVARLVRQLNTEERPLTKTTHLSMRV